ncbi:MAG: low molecular weight protein arginine phosphatase [Acidobacteria bacterium]|nr:low molecular weight protein arginine phosphatase [Acidobacteriota bacterium]
MKDGKYVLLFVCTGNICRSPMAVGLLQDELPLEVRDRVLACSAGTSALEGYRASDLAQQICRESCFDISQHMARSVAVELVEMADLVLTMTAAQKEFLKLRYFFARDRIFLLSEFATGGTDTRSIPDPYGSTYEDYQDCFRLLRKYVRLLAPKILGRIQQV